VPRPGVESVIHPAAAVAGEAGILPGKSQRYDFVLAWYTPDDIQADGSNASHYYAGLFDDAWAVATYALQYRDALLGGTIEWRDLIARSSLPAWLRSDLLSDAGSLSAATVYTKGGYFGGIDDGSGRPGALSP